MKEKIKDTIVDLLLDGVGKACSKAERRNFSK